MPPVRAAISEVEIGQESRRRPRVLDRLLLTHPAFLVLVDLTIGCVAYGGAWLLRTGVSLPFTQDLLPQERWSVVSHPWIVLGLSQVFLVFIFGLYDEMRTLRVRELIAYGLAVALVQLGIAASVIFLSGGATAGLASQRLFPRSVLVLFAGLNFLLLASWRIFVKGQLRGQRLRILIVGEEMQGMRDIITDIEQSPWMGMDIAGVVFSEEREVPSAGLEYPVLGRLHEIDALVSRYDIQEIILASSPSWKDRVLTSLSRLQAEKSIRIGILPSVYEMVIGKLHHINIHDTPLIAVRRNPTEPFQRFVKRFFDMVFSGTSLVVLLPFLLAVALLVRITSAGPALYVQSRIGRGGQPFRLYKFRTMIRDAESAGIERLSSAADPRVTPVGRLLRRLRIDELPQLINVLRGDMSFVGPRPERPGFVGEFLRTVPGYAERHKVKPGITGLAQVRSYYDTSPENKLKYDLAYIYNYSFSLDLILLLETLKVVLTRRGS